MRIRLLISILVLPTLPLGLAGCSELNLRKGPSPILDATSVEAASSNQTRIIDALAADARVNVGTPDSYYRIAEAGFNYVDDQCRDYFEQIFFIDRERSQLKSGLAAASGTTAAILGVTNASTLTMSVVASAFGFASAATDILAGTYLYSLPPATTQGFVAKLQAAFRDGAAANRANIDSTTAAYYAIQRYLSLCLPPTIEAEITKQVNSTVAVGVPVGKGSLVSVETGSSVTLPRAPAVLLPSSRTRLPAPKPTPAGPLPPGTLNTYEARLPSDQITAIQLAVCIKDPNGNLGPVDSETRKAIVEFFEGFGKPHPEINFKGGGLQSKEHEILKGALEMEDETIKKTDPLSKKSGCLEAGFLNPKQVASFMH